MNLARQPLLFEAVPARRIQRQPDPTGGRAVVGAAQAVAPVVTRRQAPASSRAETIGTTSQILRRPAQASDTRPATKSQHSFHRLSPEEAHDELDRVVSGRHTSSQASRSQAQLGPSRTLKAVMGPHGERIGADQDTSDKGTDRAKDAAFTKQHQAAGQELAARNQGGKSDESWLEKRRLPHNHPAVDHPDEGVRHRAWKMRAQAMANSMGGSYDHETKSQGRFSKAPATVRVFRHKKTGEFSMSATPHGRDHAPVPDTHDVWHSTLSERRLCRAPLLLEGIPASSQPPEPRRQPRLSSDDSLRKKLATATPDVASRLERSLAFREKLRATAPSRTQRRAGMTVQSNYPGDKTEIMRPAGHKTEVLPRVQAGAANATHVLPVAKIRPLDDVSRKASKTQSLRRVRAEAIRALAPVLTELAMTTASAWRSGLNAGDSILGAPGDKGPHKNATTSAKVGHTAVGGAAVPDKEKRKIKPPTSKIPKRTWDPITKELEKQSAFPMLQRTRTLGG